jgi:hypothetical protein
MVVRNQKMDGSGELVRCPVCGNYIGKSEGFACPRCKRKSLCRSHRVPGSRECTSCVFEMKARELGSVREEVKSIRSFLRLSQFLFLVFAILFITVKTDVAESVEFLQYSFITDNIYYLGGLAVIGFLVSYIVLYSRKRKISELEAQLTDFRRTSTRVI